MKFEVNNLLKLQINFFLSCCYGLFVYFFVSSWSFDFDQIVKTAEYFKSVDLSYAEILGFNSFSIYFFANLLDGHDLVFVVSLFFGICASFRFFVYNLLLPLPWFIPIFASMAVMLDFNTSRYSLATTLFILIFGVLQKKKFKNIGILKTSLLTIPFFHLHHFSIAFIALFSKTSFLFRTFCISLIPIIVAYFDEIFSRFLSNNTDPFPRITFIYFTLSLFLIFSRRIRLSEVKIIYSVLLLLLTFYISGVHFNNAYYTRFSFLTFEVILIFIALNSWAFRRKHNQILFSGRYLKLFFICLLSITYQIILINGNIWRFF